MLNLILSATLSSDSSLEISSRRTSGVKLKSKSWKKKEKKKKKKTDLTYLQSISNTTKISATNNISVSQI
jgi:hypothetical protein